MQAIQLTFWEGSITGEQLLRNEVTLLKQQQNNLRKGLFHRYGELNHELIFLRSEIMALKNKIEKEDQTNVFMERFLLRAK